MTTSMRFFRLLPFPLLFAAVLGVSGCTKDSGGGCPSENADVPYLTLSLQMPSSEPDTYALNPQDENCISVLDVLVFRVDPTDGKEKFLYRVATSDITDLSDTSPSGEKKSYRVKLRLSQADDRHRIVLIANQRDAVDAVVSDDDVLVAAKEDLLDELQFSTADKWPDDVTGPEYRPFPMWGESRNTHVVTSTTSSESVGTIGMVRALARFDVGVNYDSNYTAQGLANFVLTDVYVYNAMDKAAGVPLAASYAKDGNGFARVSAPTIPAGAVVVANDPASGDSPLHYTLASGAQSAERMIYVAESAARNYGDSPSLSELQGQFCLVAGGYYSSTVELAASQPNTMHKTYYRIDIYDRTKPTPQGNLLPVLRNHCYKCGITAVPGPGAETPFEALTQTPLGFEAIVDKWDDGGTNGEVNTDDENHDDDQTVVDPWENGGGNGNVDADGDGSANP